MLSSIIGNGKTVLALRHALQQGKLPHAVFLCAPAGCGRNFAARCLAAEYLYTGDEKNAALVMRGECSEVLLVEGEGKSGQIPVDKIRTVRKDVFYSSIAGPGRVVIIRDAHNMAAGAANALLKVLEEPPQNVLFILTAQSTGALPATIISRCAVYTLCPLEVEECERELLAAAQDSGNEDTKRLCKLLATLYDGRLGSAIKVLCDGQRLEDMRAAICCAKAAAENDGYTLLKIFAAYEGKNDIDRVRRQQLLEDIVCVLSAALRGRTADSLPDIKRPDAAMLLPHISGAMAALRANAPPKITFTHLAMQLT